MKNKSNITIVILSIFLLMSIGFGTTYLYYNGKSNLTKGAIITSCKISNLTLERNEYEDGYSYFIKFSIYNNADNQKTYNNIFIKLYEMDGDFITLTFNDIVVNAESVENINEPYISKQKYSKVEIGFIEQRNFNVIGLFTIKDDFLTDKQEGAINSSEINKIAKYAFKSIGIIFLMIAVFSSYKYFRVRRNGYLIILILSYIVGLISFNCFKDFNIIDKVLGLIWMAVPIVVKNIYEEIRECDKK